MEQIGNSNEMNLVQEKNHLREKSAMIKHSSWFRNILKVFYGVCTLTPSTPIS